MAQFLALALLLGTPVPMTPEFQDLVRKSMTDYNLGYFDAALKEAEDAYRLNQLPALLFNLGQCHRSLGHWARAEFFYRSYLRNNPEAKNRDLVLDLIDKMVVKEKEAPAAAAATASTTTAPASAAPAPSVVVVEAPPAAPAPTPPANETPQAASNPAAVTTSPAPAAAVSEAPATASHSHVVPWILGGGAVVATGACIWGWYEAASFSAYKQTEHTAAAVESQQSLATAGEVVGIAGAVVAAALLTGAVLTW
jgi:tetratricopeptide (TPR) repeat protein